jgi:hypothetical protein
VPPRCDAATASARRRRRSAVADSGKDIISGGESIEPRSPKN